MVVTKVNNAAENFTKETAAPGLKEKNNGSFDKIVAKATEKNNTADKTQADSTNTDNAETQGSIKSEDNAVQKNDSSKTAEASDKKDIKNIDDLISAIDSIIQQDDKENLPEEAMNLLNILSILLKGIKDPSQGALINKDNIISALQGKLNLSADKSEKIMNILEQLTTPAVSDVLKQSNASARGNSSINDIKKELFALLNNIQPQKNMDKTEGTSAAKINIVSLKEILPEIKQALASNGNGKEQNNAAADKKGNELLKSLASDNGSENGDSKINNFMSRFSVMKGETAVPVKEPQVIHQKNFATDIIKTLNYMETNSIKEMTVKINPKELGEVVINVTMESGIMKATISASNKDAYNLIQGNLQDINARLNTSEVKVSNLSLNIYNEDTTFYRNESGRENQQQGNEKNNRKVSGISLHEDDKIEDFSLEGNVNELA